MSDETEAGEGRAVPAAGTPDDTVDGAATASDVNLVKSVDGDGADDGT
ncbi:MAG: hypothetical protein QOE37_305, partial [Microbacteriaceae bacterium]|nr:hypothetical protein [Microbacteriaceae bacterium]